MGLFNAIASLFGGGKGNESDSRITVKGDNSPIPSNAITPDYRPQNGVYSLTSADLLREWEARGWIVDPQFLEELKGIIKNAELAEKNAKEFGKGLGQLSKHERGIVKAVCTTIPKVAGSHLNQFQANQRMLSAMDGLAGEYQKSIEARRLDTERINQNLKQFRTNLEAKRQALRGR